MAFAMQETFYLIDVVFQHCCDAKALLLYICKRAIYALIQYYLTTDVLIKSWSLKNIKFPFLPSV
jgi:hypothetical protein